VKIETIFWITRTDTNIGRRDHFRGPGGRVREIQIAARCAHGHI